ncbi:MAG: EAL domain-containing protein [Gammaproteobacteria bacterium]|nr:EAL domain-containing protein [Gammaproteobacteria bacterium]
MSEANTPKRILILDDDADFRGLLRVYLGKLFPGTEVEEYDPVARGAPGDDFDWSRYDALILDYYLCIHNVTGLDILQAHRAKRHFPATVMMTGAGNEEIAVRALRAGVYDYLRKEKFDKQQLRDSLVAAVEKHRAERARLSEQTSHNRAFNKALFYQELEHGGERGIEADRILLLVDLDEHATLEERFGVIIRDNLVRHLAKLCYEFFKAAQTDPHITRLSDQSVSLLINAPGSFEALNKIMAELCAHLQENPYRFEEKKLRFTVSIGVVPVPKFGRSAEALLQTARDCVLMAGIQDRNSFHIHIPKATSFDEDLCIPEPIPEPLPEPEPIPVPVVATPPPALESAIEEIPEATLTVPEPAPEWTAVPASVEPAVPPPKKTVLAPPALPPAKSVRAEPPKPAQPAPAPVARQPAPAAAPPKPVRAPQPSSAAKAEGPSVAPRREPIPGATATPAAKSAGVAPPLSRGAPPTAQKPPAAPETPLTTPAAAPPQPKSAAAPTPAIRPAAVSRVAPPAVTKPVVSRPAPLTPAPAASVPAKAIPPAAAPAAKAPNDLQLDESALSPEALAIKWAFNDNRVTQLFSPVISLTDAEQTTGRDIYRIGLQIVEKTGQVTGEEAIYGTATAPALRQFIDRWQLRETIGRVVRQPKDRYLFLLRLSGASLADPGLFNWLRKLLAGFDNRQPGRCIGLELAAADFLEREKPVGALMAYLHKSHGFRFALGQLHDEGVIQAAGVAGEFDLVLMHFVQLKALANNRPGTGSGPAPLLERLRAKGRRILVDDIQDSMSLTEAIGLGADLAMGRFVGEPIPELDEVSGVHTMELV